MPGGLAVISGADGTWLLTLASWAMLGLVVFMLAIAFFLNVMGP
jgi:hypothetical protein